MDKNNEYVGVDEKYIPENEKYVTKKKKNSAKKLGIGMLIIYGIFFLIVIIAVIFVFKQVFGIMGDMTERMNQSNVNSVSNAIYESYSGTQSGYQVEILLDKVVTNNKKDPNHIITVLYNNQTTTNPTEIVNIKHLLDEGVNYEISLDYDTNGLVNKITITTI